MENSLEKTKKCPKMYDFVLHCPTKNPTYDEQDIFLRLKLNTNGQNSEKRPLW